MHFIRSKWPSLSSAEYIGDQVCCVCSGKSNLPRIWWFPKCFYTSYWVIIGDYVVAVMQNFFSSCKFLKASSTFILSLIHKCPNPSSLNDFRPISHLKFSSKIITVILAKVLPLLLLPSSCMYSSKIYPWPPSLGTWGCIKAESKISRRVLLYEIRHLSSFWQIELDVPFQLLTPHGL